MKYIKNLKYTVHVPQSLLGLTLRDRDAICFEAIINATHLCYTHADTAGEEQAIFALVERIRYSHCSTSSASVYPEILEYLRINTLSLHCQQIVTTMKILNSFVKNLTVWFKDQICSDFFLQTLWMIARRLSRSSFLVEQQTSVMINDMILDWQGKLRHSSNYFKNRSVPEFNAPTNVPPSAAAIMAKQASQTNRPHSDPSQLPVPALLPVLVLVLVARPSRE